MTRLEALERVAEAARATLKAYSIEKVCAADDALSAALDALDTLPPEPAGDVVELAVYQSPSGDTHLVKIGSAYDKIDGFSNNWTRLGTARLVLAKEETP